MIALKASSASSIAPGIDKLFSALPAQITNVLIQRLAELDLVLDSFRPRHHHGRKSDIRIAARVRSVETSHLALGEAEYIGMRHTA